MSGARTAHAPTPLWDLVEESLDEAEFLWGRWEKTLSAHDRDLEGLWYWVEDRLLGSLDGVRVGGEAALAPLLLPALESEDPWRATAAAHVLAAEAKPWSVEALLGAALAAAPERLGIFRRALELTSSSDVMLARLERELGAASPAHRELLLAVRTFQQREPASAVAEALSSRDPLLEAAGLRALRHGSVQSGASEVSRQLDSADAEVARAAVETGLILGLPAAWSRCQQLAAAAEAGCGWALLSVGLLGQEPDQAALFSALASAPLRREAIEALGFAGTRAAAEACLEAMADEKLSRLAAHAFCTITGLDLEAEKLVATEAEPDEPVPFEEEDLDADLVPTEDDLLPLPDVAGVRAWWAQHGQRFRAGQRYHAGQPVSVEVLQEALVRGPNRRRHALAFELAVRTAGRYQVQTRTWTRGQKQQLAGFGALAAGGMPRSLLARAFGPV